MIRKGDKVRFLGEEACANSVYKYAKHFSINDAKLVEGEVYTVHSIKENRLWMDCPIVLEGKECSHPIDVFELVKDEVSESKLKIGDKVKIPKTKHGLDINDEHTTVINIAKGMGQDYLYVTGTPDNSYRGFRRNYYMLNETMADTGDYFSLNDLELYVDIDKSYITSSPYDDSDLENAPIKPIIINPTNKTKTIEGWGHISITTDNTLNKKEEYLKFHKSVCDELVEITRKKNSDYTGVNDNPFANFTSVESRGICSTEQGFLTRMNDKFERIISFVNKGTLEVSDESIKDSLSDLANYSILFMGYLNQKSKDNE